MKFILEIKGKAKSAKETISAYFKWKFSNSCYFQLHLGSILRFKYFPLKLSAMVPQM